jgi:hypothetical protein
MTEELKPRKERRVAIAAFNGCMKAKRNEFCLPCVVQATGYDGKVTGDRRAMPHAYTRTPDTISMVDVDALRDFAQSVMDIPDSFELAHVSVIKLGAALALGVKYDMPKPQAPRSDTSAVELVEDLYSRLVAHANMVQHQALFARTQNWLKKQKGQHRC